MVNLNAKPAMIEIDQMLREAEAVHLTDYWRLEALADEILGLARRAMLPDRAAAGLAYKAWARLHLDDSDGALRCALEALIIAREYGDRRVEYRALKALSSTFERGGLVDETLRLLALQQEIVAEFNEPRLAASVMNNIGVSHLSRDPARAAEIFLEALSVLPNDDDSRTRRVIMAWNAAMALNLTGELDLAMSHGRLAMAIAREVGSRHWAARAQVTVSFTTALQGKYEQAHALLEDVRAEMEALAFPVLTGEFYYIYGLIMLEEGRYHEAVGAAEDAYQILFDHDLVNLQIDLLKTLVRAYEKTADLPGVINTYRRLTEGVLRQQERGAAMRFAVMKTAFDIDQAGIEAFSHAHAGQTEQPSHGQPDGADGSYSSVISPQVTRMRLLEIASQVEWTTVMTDDIGELLSPFSEEVPVVTFTVDELVSGVLADIDRYRLKPERVTIEDSVGADAALRGTFDALRRVLVQLLSNALKFSSGTVDFALTIADGELVASVTDSGIGIPPQEHLLVMHPMYRASNNSDANASGFGLALVDKLVKAAGASLSLDSDVGAGTTVTLHWPLES